MFTPLTSKEKQIIKMICEKEVILFSQIANALKIKLCTVCTHMQHIYVKLAVANRKELIFKYYNDGKEKWEIN